MIKIKSLLNPNSKKFWDKKYGQFIEERHIRSDGKHLLKLMHLFEKSGSILDFGSGLGGNVQYLAGQLKNTSFILVDHSRTSLEFAKNQLLGLEDGRGNRFSYHPDMEQIPEGTVDLVMSIQVLEHITEYRQVMDRLWSSLKPGGTMLVSVPVKGIRDRNRQHINKFTVSSMFRILTGYGEFVHIAPRTYSVRSGRLSTAYFYVEKSA